MFWFTDAYPHKPFSSFKNLAFAATDSMITEANTTFIACLMGMQWHIHELALRHIQCVLLFALCGLHIINKKCPKLTHLGGGGVVLMTIKDDRQHTSGNQMVPIHLFHIKTTEYLVFI